MDMSDGEIMDGEEAPDVIKMNKMAQIAEDTLRSKTKLDHANRLADSAEEHKGEAISKNASKGKRQDVAASHLPDDLLCCICLNNRKSVMIQSCKHMVFCFQCDRDFQLKNHLHKECPICRKEFKKTIPVYFS